MSAAANRGALKRKVSAAGFIIDCLEGLDASDALDVLDEVRFALLGELPNEGEPDETIVSELKLDPLAGSSDALDTEDEREPTTAERVAAILMEGGFEPKDASTYAAEACAEVGPDEGFRSIVQCARQLHQQRLTDQEELDATDKKPVTADDVFAEIKKRGQAKPTVLRGMFELNQDRMKKMLDELIASGRVERFGRGVYRVADPTKPKKPKESASEGPTMIVLETVDYVRRHGPLGWRELGAAKGIYKRASEARLEKAIEAGLIRRTGESQYEVCDEPIGGAGTPEKQPKTSTSDSKGATP